MAPNHPSHEFSPHEIRNRFRGHDQFKYDISKMAKNANISIIEPFPLHKKNLRGYLVFYTTNSMRRFAQQFVRLFFAKQIRMNQLMVEMSFKVANLEKRVMELEKKHKNL